MGVITLSVDEYEAISEKLSTTKPKNPREDRDLYRTRPNLAEPLTQVVVDMVKKIHLGSGLLCNQKDPIYVLEPGCYDGPFLKAFNKAWDGRAPLCLTGVDIIDEPEDFDSENAEYEKLDYLALTENDKSFLKSTVILGNPPFSLAEEFVRTSMELVDKDGVVAMLLQSGFLGAIRRREFFKQFTPWEINMLVPRAGFVREGKSNGTDMREYILALWRPWNPPGATQFKWLDWKEEK